jgi:PKD repeat protein
MAKRNAKRRNVYVFVALVVVALATVTANSTPLNSGSNSAIEIALEYGSGPQYDADNDGIETLSGVIDFTVENTKFSEAIDEANLCTRWGIYSIENGEKTTLCYGNEKCCNFIGLTPTRGTWKEPLYLTYGLYSASYSNIVSSQVIYVDYDLTLGSPYSSIYYSEWAELPAYFSEQDAAKSFGISSASSGAGDSIGLNITSPPNSTALGSGEGIYLNFTSNATVNASYSLDEGSVIWLGSGTSFSASLSGNLPYGVLGNGKHNLSIYAEGSDGNKTINYSFMVNDTTWPNISINISNNSAISATYLVVPLNISSNEYANVSCIINNNLFSVFGLGEDKTEVVNLTVENGRNNLTINATDFHSNSILYHYSFNFTEAGTCEDGRQNGDEEGIDCGGRCTACINFDVSVNKGSYNLTDSVYVTVTARAGSIVNLTLLKDSEVAERHTFTPVFSGAPISEIRLLENTSNAGNYTINATMYYLNITENKKAYFEVLPPSDNPLSVTINANTTTINEGGSVLFNATVSGNTGNVQYRWDFENDGVIDSTDAVPTKTYNTNGSYIVNLTVSDSVWNQTDVETITVRKLYNTTFVVKSNATKEALENAEVAFGDTVKNTSSDGKAIFTNPEGEYSLEVKKPGYKDYSQKVLVEGSSTIEINLTRKDDAAPVVELISPENGQAVGNSYVFAYKAVDETDMTCKLYIASADSGQWEIKGTDANVKSGAESTLVAEPLSNGAYKWRVECIDREGNSNSSAVYSFTVEATNPNNSSNDSNEESSSEIIEEINEALKGLEKLGRRESEAAKAMKLRKTLEKAITAIQRANRDIHSLKWRKLSDEEMEAETNKILQRIENVKKTTPKSIQVIEATEFVVYPNKEDIELATRILLNRSNLKTTKKVLRKAIEANKKIQSSLTVTTKSKLVELEYFSGDKRTITLIEKVVNMGANLSGVVLYEVIPKEIAAHINEAQFFFEYETIESDPVVALDINEIAKEGGSFAYYINKSTDLKETEKIKSVLLSKNFESGKKSPITGLAVVDDIISKFTDTTDIRLVIEIAIIILLAGVYLFYSFGSPNTLGGVFQGKEVKEINRMVDLALRDVDKGDYENASSKYKEILSKFNKLGKEQRDSVRSAVTGLLDKVNLLYINKLVEEARKDIKENNRGEAYSIYSKIQSLYRIIPKAYKAEVLKKCLTIHKELNS